MNHNFRLLHTLYASTFGKYIKFKQRYDKAVQSGRFKKLSKAKQSLLISRLRKLYDRLKSLQAQLRLAGLGAAFSLSMALTNSVSAQSTLGPFVRADEKNPLPPPFITTHPRVAVVDIDGDGDVDTFVGNADGNIQFLRNDSPTSGGIVHKFIEITGYANPFYGINKGSHAAPAFADVDGDGDFDMLLGTNYGPTFFFRNTGTRTNPVFSEQTGSGNPFNGIKGNGNEESIPSFVDIDGDGDIDLFVGSTKYSFQSSVNFYQNQGSPTTPNFVSTEHPIQYLDVFNQTYDSNNSSLAFTDIDGDGNLDLVSGRNGNRLRVFINNGTGESFTETNGPWDSELNMNFYNGSPAFGDFDRDGDLDLIVGTQQWRAPSILYYENTDGDFTLKANNEPNANNPFGGVFTHEMARVTFADIDDDHDLDAIVTGKYNFDLRVYENNEGDFTRNLNHPLTEIFLPNQALPTFADIDGDGDLDLFVGGNNYSYAVFFRNTNGLFLSEESPLPSSLAHAFFDIDDDGDLDAIITHDGENPIEFYRNTGTRTNPVFTLIDTPAPFNNFETKYLAYVTATDFDHDGDMDIVVSENTRYSDYVKTKFRFIENMGDESFEQIESPFEEMTSREDYITFADIDDDGDDDLFIGFGDTYGEIKNGTFRYFENQNPQPVTNVIASTLVATGSQRIVLDPTLTITDEDNDDIVLATITIGDYESGDEVLTFTASALPAGVNGVFDTQTGILTFSGKSTLALYQVLLRTVAYEYSGVVPAAAMPVVPNARKNDVAKTITFAVRDTDFTLTTVSIVNLTLLSGEQSELRIYNAVSANGDNQNSHFRIEGLDAQNKVTIVNRWGDRVYEVSGYNSEDTGKRFEGKGDNGKDLPTGTYYYTIEVGGKKVTGFLSLKR